MRSVLGKLNPLYWSNRTLKVLATLIYLIILPLYIIFNLSPAKAAEEYPISAQLNIPSIALDVAVTPLEMQDSELEAPTYIVGSFTHRPNKTLLIAHSTTAFANLKSVQLGDIIHYNERDYYVSDISTFAKADVNMAEILQSSPAPIIVLMTCAGQLLPDSDATHRLVVTAV